MYTLKHEFSNHIAQTNGSGRAPIRKGEMLPRAGMVPSMAHGMDVTARKGDGRINESIKTKSVA